MGNMSSKKSLLPTANWHRRRHLLEGCLVGTGAGRLPRDLVGIVDGYCGESFEGTSAGLMLTGHTGLVRSVCALGDGRLASGSRDRSLRIWCWYLVPFVKVFIM